MDLPHVKLDFRLREPGTVPFPVLEDARDDPATRIARVARRTVRNASDITLSRLAAEAGPVLRSELSRVEAEIDAEVETFGDLAVSLGLDDPAGESDRPDGIDVLEAAKEAAWRSVAYSAVVEVVAGWGPDGDFDQDAMFELAGGSEAARRLCTPTGFDEDLAQTVLRMTIWSMARSDSLAHGRPYLGKGCLSALFSTGAMVSSRSASTLLFVDADGGLEESESRIVVPGTGRMVGLEPFRAESEGPGRLEITFPGHPGTKVRVEGEFRLPAGTDDPAIAIQGKSTLEWTAPAPHAAFSGVSGDRTVIFGARL